jgi:hypothetical protein
MNKPHKLREILRAPFGRLLWTKDRGESMQPGNMFFQSHLEAQVIRVDGSTKRYDLGSGLVTNSGVNLMANDLTWVTGATLKQMNYHLSGTGTTAAAAPDIFCQTPVSSASLTGSTNGFFTGVQSYVSPNIYKTVATFTYNTTVAVTEWALCMINAATLSRTSAGAAPTNNTFTDTGATFTTSGQGLAAYTIEIAATVINTPTTTVMGQILSNSATVLTIQGPSASAAWVTLANAVASVPGATVAYQVIPTAFDHKVFSAINVNNGDSIQFTYSLTVNSGG